MKQKQLGLLALFLMVLLSRLPFLSPGYGIEEDSWAIALAAFHTKLTGIYEPSRLPGHPGQELLLSLLWGIGSWWYNFLSALMSAVATLFFAKILDRFGFRNYWLAALAFSFVPVFYISSTYTIDFVWTACFVMISWYLLLRNSLLACGIFLGIAVACRITSGIMLLPFMMAIWEAGHTKKMVRSFLLISIPMGVVTALFFLPVFLQFGSGFFMYYDQFPYPSLPKVFYKMIPGVVGSIGCIALLVFGFFAWKNRKHGGAEFSPHFSRRWLFICWLMIVLFSISYFRLPQKSGYMVPVLPFVFLLFAYYLPKKQFLAFCLFFLISPFLGSINLTDKLRGAQYSSLAVKTVVSGQELFFDPLSGPIQSDHSKRILKANYVQQLLDKTANMDSTTMIIAGWWYNQLMVEQIQQAKKSKVKFVGYVDEKEMKVVKDNKGIVYFLPEQNRYNDLMFGMNCTNQLASEFPF